MKHLEVAMPCVMVDEYVPKVCEELKTRQDLIARLSDKSKLIKPIQGMKNFTELRVAPDSGNRKWFYCVDLNANDILYLMHLNPLKMKFPKEIDVPENLRRFAIYQGSVWRAEGSVPKMGQHVPSTVFWNLFKGRQNWFSDSLQSRDGKRFWENRIEEALTIGYPVYAVHFDQTNNIEVDSIVKIELGDSIEHYWTCEKNKDDRGLYWRFAIAHP